MSAFPYQFEGRIERYVFETYAYTVIFLPQSLAARPPFQDKPRLRIGGEVAEHPVAGAWQPGRRGGRYFLLSKRFLKESELSPGDVVEMRFGLDDPNAVTMPPAIAGALQRNKAFAKAWATLTPGAQRAFAHRVSSAKTAPTEQRRLAEVTEMVLKGVRPGAPTKARRSSKRVAKPGLERTSEADPLTELDRLRRSVKSALRRLAQGGCRFGAVDRSLTHS